MTTRLWHRCEPSHLIQLTGEEGGRRQRLPSAPKVKEIQVWTPCTARNHPQRWPSKGQLLPLGLRHKVCSKGAAAIHLIRNNSLHWWGFRTSCSLQYFSQASLRAPELPLPLLGSCTSHSSTLSVLSQELALGKSTISWKQHHPWSDLLSKNHCLETFSNSLLRNKGSYTATREVSVLGTWTAPNHTSTCVQWCLWKRSGVRLSDWMDKKTWWELSQKSMINYWTLHSLIHICFFHLKAKRGL